MTLDEAIERLQQIREYVTDDHNPDPVVVICLQGVDFVEIEEIISSKHPEDDPADHTVLIVADRSIGFD